MRIDVNASVGAYAWRRVPGTSPASLLQAMERVAIDQAWVTHLPGLFWRDPTEGNDWLYRTCAADSRLLPVPAVHPGLAHWSEIVVEARDRGAPAVRCDPTFYGMNPTAPELEAVAAECARVGLPLQLAVRLEDARQRHPNDRADELPPWAVRRLVRSDPAVRLLVTHADRGFIEEVHFGSTPEEAARIWWDICWLWGPPEDHLAQMLATVGVERFVFGTGQPLRLPENGVAKLDLLDLTPAEREAIESANVRALLAT